MLGGVYYYPQENKPCYYCIVSRNYIQGQRTEFQVKNSVKLQQALNQVLARERMKMHVLTQL